jgi:hypothetical protein
VTISRIRTNWPSSSVGIPLEEFRRQFEYLVNGEPPPLMVDAEGESSR